MIKIILPFTPRTKKNSMQIFKTPSGKPFLTPSKAYKQYIEDCKIFLTSSILPKGIDCSVNVRCLYFMPTKRKVDLVNLLNATCNALVLYGVIKDDNSSIIVSHNGSRVLYDKEMPRTEIYIELID